MHPLNEFEQALKCKWGELRPSFKFKYAFSSFKELTTIQLEELVANPMFKKIFILDRTLTDREIFEMGYLLWEECDRNMEKLFDLFIVKVENGNLVLKEIEK